MSIQTISFPEASNYIGGKFLENNARSMPVISPLDGSTISSVPLSGKEALDEAEEGVR